VLPAVWDGARRENYRQILDCLEPYVEVLKPGLMSHPLNVEEILGIAPAPNVLAIPAVNKSNLAEILLDWAMARAATSKPRRVPRGDEWAVTLGTKIYQSTGMRLASVRDKYTTPHATLLSEVPSDLLGGRTMSGSLRRLVIQVCHTVMEA
jgi:hypothetical protein